MKRYHIRNISMNSRKNYLLRSSGTGNSLRYTPEFGKVKEARIFDSQVSTNDKMDFISERNPAGELAIEESTR